MKLKKLWVLPMFIFGLTTFSFTQDEESRNLIKDDPEYITIPVNVSWFPGFSLGESTAKGRKIINLFSLNILAGRAARLRGVEFGGLWNSYTEDIRGFQASGVVNSVGGKGQGIQLAGVINEIKGYFRGFQSAGVINIVRDRFNGFQAAGVGNFIENASQGIQACGTVNIIGDNFKGVQISGALNSAGGDIQGVQLAGALNLVDGAYNGFQSCGAVNVATKSFDGAQIAGAVNLEMENFKGVQVAGAVNITNGAFRGVQIASVVNIANQFEKGLQLGVINVAKEHHGLPLGLVTIVKENQYLSFEFSGSEVFYGQAAIKFGLPYFYNIYSFGKWPGDANRWAYGFGFGTEGTLGRNLIFNVEAVTHQELWIDEDRVRSFLTIDRLNLLNQLKFSLGIPLGKALQLFGGPVFNVLVADHNKDYQDLESDIGPAGWIYERKSKNWRQTDVKIWIGFTAGLRF